MKPALAPHTPIPALGISPKVFFLIKKPKTNCRPPVSRSCVGTAHTCGHSQGSFLISPSRQNRRCPLIARGWEKDRRGCAGCRGAASGNAPRGGRDPSIGVSSLSGSGRGGEEGDIASKSVRVVVVVVYCVLRRENNCLLRFLSFVALVVLQQS